jgi:hypothetical protein
LLLKISLGVILLCLMHICVWWGTNAQLLDSYSQKKAFWWAVFLSIPITLFAFYATRILYESVCGSLWAVRFIGFGVSYLIFPIMTWYFLGESMLTVKTVSCIFLSGIIVAIQIFL